MSSRHLQSSLSRVEKTDQKLRGIRAGVFVAIAFSAFMASRPAAPSVWTLLASAAILFFVVLIVVHQRLKDRLKIWRGRVALEGQLEALSMLTPRPGHLVFSDLEFKDSHLVRDLDILGASGFVSLFPFFITSEGYRRFVRRLVEPPPSLSDVQARQQRVKFWERSRVLRRALLRRSSTLETVVNTEELQTLTAKALSALPARGLYIRFAIIFAIQIVLVLAFPLGVKWLATSALIAWLGAYVLFARDLDLLAAYPRAMQLGRSLRVMKELVTRLQSVPGADVAGGAGALMGAAGPLPVLARVEQAAGALGVRQNPLVAILINVLGPWDFFWAIRMELARRDLEHRIGDWTAALAELEVDCALAEWNRAHGVSWPEFTDDTGFGIDGRGIVHPLLSKKKRVANDIRLARDQRCHLVTGSNMAGKSTFLRSIGMNVIIAQAGAKVPAAALKLAPIRVESSLRPSDSLADGFSSFYAEVSDLVDILKRAGAESGMTSLYLIDEIFRGTNNRERRIGAEAVIRALAGTRAFGLVTTHDLDLSTLEGSVDGLRNHHFRDDVVDGVMTFSYEYKSGPCPSTNAIKVMVNAGLPVKGQI